MVLLNRLLQGVQTGGRVPSWPIGTGLQIEIMNFIKF